MLRPLDILDCIDTIRDTTIRCANPTRVGAIDSEIEVIRERIENWRRHNRTIQRVIAVSWYTKPESGEVMQDDHLVILPTDMRDALKLELAWRNLDREAAVKWYIKWAYIQRGASPAIWRRLKAYGVRIKNNHEYQSFDRLALERFGRLI